MTEHDPQPDRLTRVEEALASLAKTVSKLESLVERLAANQGRPNWNMLGVLATVTIAFGGATAAVIFGPISANATEIKRLSDSLSAGIQREIERNNRLEREMGAAQMIDTLFMNGKLKLE